MTLELIKRHTASKRAHSNAIHTKQPLRPTRSLRSAGEPSKPCKRHSPAKQKSNKFHAWRTNKQRVVKTTPKLEGVLTGFGADIFVVFPAGAAQPRVFVDHNRVAVPAKFSSGVRSAIPLSDIENSRFLRKFVRTSCYSSGVLVSKAPFACLNELPNLSANPPVHAFAHEHRATVHLPLALPPTTRCCRLIQSSGSSSSAMETHWHDHVLLRAPQGLVTAPPSWWQTCQVRSGSIFLDLLVLCAHPERCLAKSTNTTLSHLPPSTPRTLFA